MGKIARAKDQLIQTVSLGTPNLGLFLDLPEDEVPLAGWSDGYNYVVNSNYRVTPRLGRELLFDLDAELEDMPSDTRTYGIHELRSAIPAGADRLYIFIGNKIAVYNGATWAWVTLPSGYTITPGRWQFCQFGDATTEYLVCCSEGNDMLYIDHMGVATCPDTTDFYAANLQPKWCTVYQGRIWIGGDPLYPTSIFSSYAGSASWTFGGTPSDADPLEMIIGWRDGEPINGIFAKHGILFIIKENSVWFVDATDAAQLNWFNRKIRSGIGGGVGCGYSVRDVGGDVLYMSRNGDLRTLYDTDRAGLYDSTSLSMGQIRTYLRGFWYDECDSVVDQRNGWYLLSAAPNTVDRNNLFTIFDFGKKTEDGRGPWYRVAPMNFYDDVATATFTENSRACFGESWLLSADSSSIVISGGYTGYIYKEFAQTEEDLDNGGTVKILSWITGSHIHQEDFTDSEMLEVYAFAHFGGAPVGSSLSIGAIIDPLQAKIKRLVDVALTGDYADVMYWGITNWGAGRWGVSADEPIVIPIHESGKTFAFHVLSYGSRAELYRTFLTFRARRT